MRGGEAVHVEYFAVGGAASVEFRAVVGSDSHRAELRMSRRRSGYGRLVRNRWRGPAEKGGARRENAPTRQTAFPFRTLFSADSHKINPN